MKVDLDGKKIEVTVFEHRKNNYEYFIGNVQIGEIDTNIVKYDNIIMSKNSIVKSLEKMGVLEKDQQEKQNTLENELSAKIKDQIDNLSREEIRKSAKETQGIDRYIEENNIPRKQIKDVKILELNRKEKDSKSKHNKTETLKTKEQEIEKTTTKDINVKQELNLDERANDMHSIRKWLGGQVPHSIEKIGVIEADQMDEMKNEKGQKYKNLTTRYSLVAIGKDGTVEPLQKYIPELEQRDASGNNPVEEKYQVDDQGDVEKDSILSEYQIGEKIIQIDNKECGRIEMNIGEVSRDTNETLGMQVRDSNTIYSIDTDIRRTMGEYESNGEYTIEENLEEIKSHEKENPNCNEVDYKEIDGDPNTKSHNHIEEYLKRLKENDQIDKVFTEKEIKEMLDKGLENGKTIDQIEGDLEEDARHFKTREL